MHERLAACREDSSVREEGGPRAFDRHVDRSLRMGPSALGMDECHVTIIRGVQFKCPGEIHFGQVQTVDARLNCVLRSVSVTGEASGFSEMRFRALEHAQSQICRPEIVGGSTSAGRSRHRISGVSVKSPCLECSLPRYETFPRLLACSPVQSFTGSESVPGSRPSGPPSFEGRRNVPRDCRCGARISSLDSGNEFDEPRCQPVGDCARPTSEPCDSSSTRARAAPAIMAASCNSPSETHSRASG